MNVPAESVLEPEVVLSPPSTGSGNSPRDDEDFDFNAVEESLPDKKKPTNRKPAGRARYPKASYLEVTCSIQFIVREIIIGI